MWFVCFILVASLFLSFSLTHSELCLNICMQFQRETDHMHIMHIASDEKYWQYSIEILTIQTLLVWSASVCLFSSSSLLLYSHNHRRRWFDCKCNHKWKWRDPKRTGKTNREIGISFIFFSVELLGFFYIFFIRSFIFWSQKKKHICLLRYDLCAPRLPEYNLIFKFLFACCASCSASMRACMYRTVSIQCAN